MNEEHTLPEGYYNPQCHTYLHYTENDFMDCNPKSYKYILQLEDENQKLKETNEEHRKLNGQFRQQIDSLKDYLKMYAKKTKNQRIEIDGLTKQRDKLKKKHEYLKQENKTNIKLNQQLREDLIVMNNKNMELVEIIDEIYEFVEWHYEDNRRFYKNKGVGLNYPETDYVLNKLKGGKDVKD